MENQPQISRSRYLVVLIVVGLAAAGIVSGIVFNVDERYDASWLPWVVLGLSALALWLMAGMKLSGGEVSNVMRKAAPRELDAPQPHSSGKLGTFLFIVVAVMGAIAVSPPAWVRELLSYIL